jgi:hypothetical protein
MKITALPPQKHAPDRLSVFVDGALRMGLSAEIVLAAGLRVGDTVDDARLAELERRDRPCALAAPPSSPGACG